ncbi:hypothetical protein CDAR_76621 [Caerostris darwini]|uniref:Uncharacterized protein n=1 Tax=Caerostris darwini TaxID=1538125 RepID=A0AAV4QEY4_9ARAC|nr:hypothetical protein CDAR_76621 [Caerostris darwini]
MQHVISKESESSHHYFKDYILDNLDFVSDCFCSKAEVVGLMCSTILFSKQLSIFFREPKLFFLVMCFADSPLSLAIVFFYFACRLSNCSNSHSVPYLVTVQYLSAVTQATLLKWRAVSSKQISFVRQER